MIKRLYIHNYRGLDNFELSIQGQSSILLIGKNGSGKTTVGKALQVLQQIAQGAVNGTDLVSTKDFTREHTDVPMRFEIEVELDGQAYQYSIAFECLRELDEIRIFDERLVQDGQQIFNRKSSLLDLNSAQGFKSFPIGTKLLGFSVVQDQALSTFKQWLAHMLILAPIPNLISGEASGQTFSPTKDVSNFSAWFSAVIQQSPAAYGQMYEYLKEVLPDLKEIQNLVSGQKARYLIVQFSNNNGVISLDFSELSDGEKCFMICALVLAANRTYGPLLCFWDEPDNYLALDEVGHFVMALRRAFLSDGGQFIATSHNPEAIRCFSDENTFVMHRKNHLEPTIIRPLSELQVNGDLINALIRGDVEP